MCAMAPKKRPRDAAPAPDDGDEDRDKLDDEEENQAIQLEKRQRQVKRQHSRMFGETGGATFENPVADHTSKGKKKGEKGKKGKGK